MHNISLDAGEAVCGCLWAKIMIVQAEEAQGILTEVEGLHATAEPVRFLERF